MKTTTHNPVNSFLLSANPAPMSFLSFQIVYHYREDKKFIKSFNILAGEKLLKKIYLKEMILSDEGINIESFITGELLKAIDGSSDNSQDYSAGRNNKKSAFKSKPDYNARIKAAGSLFSDLGL